MNLSSTSFLRTVQAWVAPGAAALLAAGLAGCGGPSTPADAGNSNPTTTLPAPTQSPDSVKAALTTPAADATSTDGTPAAGADTATAKKPVSLPLPRPLGKPKAALPVAQPLAASKATAAPTASVASALAAALAPPAASTRTQVGRVLDEAGQPLVGATVLLKGSRQGTSTDAEGNYALEVPSGEATLLVGYGGYTDETATTRTSQPLTVTLLPDPDSKVWARKER